MIGGTGWWCVCSPTPGDGSLCEAAADGGSHNALVHTVELAASLPAEPRARERTVPARFSAPRGEPLRGPALRRGRLFYVLRGEDMREACLSVHSNGFSVGFGVPEASGDVSHTAFARIFSPFAVVEPCELQVPKVARGEGWCGLRLTFLSTGGDDCRFFFAVEGLEASERRDGWAQDLASAVQRVACSLFPVHSITVWPISSVPATASRILAGYLLRCEDLDSITVLYCELHAYSGGRSFVAFYTDEFCTRALGCLEILARTLVTCRKAVGSGVFQVEDHLLCARSPDEKDLWYRALTNVKVKLTVSAPDPSTGEINMIRSAISERVLGIDWSVDSLPCSSEPLLPPLAPCVSGEERPPNLLDPLASVSADHPLVREAVPTERGPNEVLHCRPACAVDLLAPRETQQRDQQQMLVPWGRDLGG